MSYCTYCVKLYPRALSWAKSSLRSCLINWTRYSLLGKLQQGVSNSAGPAWRSLTHLMESMDSGLCWLSFSMSQWILSSVGWAWLWVNESWALMVELEYCPNKVLESVTFERRPYLINFPRPTMKSSNPMSCIWVCNSRRRPYRINLTTNNPMRQPII